MSHTIINGLLDPWMNGSAGPSHLNFASFVYGARPFRGSKSKIKVESHRITPFFYQTASAILHFAFLIFHWEGGSRFTTFHVASQGIRVDWDLSNLGSCEKDLRKRRPLGRLNGSEGAHRREEFVPHSGTKVAWRPSERTRASQLKVKITIIFYFLKPETVNLKSSADFRTPMVAYGPPPEGESSAAVREYLCFICANLWLMNPDAAKNPLRIRLLS
jgi:hypothetical protein